MRLLAKGQVQGVGFRWFVKSRAEALDLHGWVRNLYDGNVEIQVDGSPAALQELCKLIMEGNNWCRVDTLTETEQSEEIDDDDGFQVRF